ncbi:F-box protein SKIP23-like [Macadamia integrifolia]|uniref:F-box protein SKIP23-like n=1 Tax=Macadamia integrifolia TaxID=60698 RepID=UPI001C4E67BF|nr:F-box protein SKIP23-like [Macadamia integrifolia]
MMAGDWSQLPPDLLGKIAQNLNLFIDYLRFRAVCVNWRSEVPKRPLHLPTQLPWLMLNNKRGNEIFRGFFSLSEDKIHWLELPEASRRERFRGSSQGWLVVVGETPMITLLNPLTRVKFYLPPLSTFPTVLGFDISQVGREYLLKNSSGHRYTRNLREMRDRFMQKVIVSSNLGTSSDADYVILAVLNETGDLAFCRRGDEAWSLIPDAQSYCEDVIDYKGSFHAVDKYGRIAICDVGDTSVVVKLIETPRLFGGDILYLVELSGELFLVMKYLELKPYDEPDLIYKTTRFEVSKFDSSGPIWNKVENLGDYALFLGKNSSLSVPASHFPGCRANCIYFTDDYSEANYEGVCGEHDLGIFNLGDGSVELLPCYSQHSQLIWPPPLWVSPNPLIILKSLAMQQDPRMLPPEEVSNARLRKKKASRHVAPVFQMQGENLKGVQETLPSSFKVTQKAQKRNLKSEGSPSFQQPERSTSDSLPDSSRSANDYRALRRKYLLLEEESCILGRELEEVEDEVKALEDEKLALLDQLVVLEGLIDPSELQPRGPPLS